MFPNNEYGRFRGWHGDTCSPLLGPRFFTFTAQQRSCGKVMFSVVYVRRFVHKASQRGPHVTIIHDALDLTIQGTSVPAMVPPL